MNTKRIANRNQAQSEYVAATKAALELTKKIQRAILAKPASCDGNWALVGDAKRDLAELQAIAERLLGLGEYAKGN